MNPNPGLFLQNIYSRLVHKSITIQHFQAAINLSDRLARSPDNQNQAILVFQDQTRTL